MSVHVHYDPDGDILEVIWGKGSYEAKPDFLFDLYLNELEEIIGICFHQVKKTLYKEGLERFNSSQGVPVSTLAERKFKLGFKGGIGEFKFRPNYHPIQDWIDVYLGSERCYVESIANNVDLFLMPRTGRVLGCKVYGIAKLIGEKRVEFKKEMNMIDGDTKIYFKCKKNVSTLPDGEAFYSFEFSHNIVDKNIIDGLTETFLTIRRLGSNDGNSFHFHLSKMLPELTRDTIIANVLSTIKNICKGYDFVDFALESKE